MMRRELLRQTGVLCATGLATGYATKTGQAMTPENAATPSENQGDDLVWHDVREWGVEGKGWSDTEDFYDRLPARAQAKVRKPIWDLSRDAAGMAFRFETDATAFSARWTLRSETLAMPHMPATGVSGLDLYARAAGGRMRWVGSGIPKKAPDNEAVLATGLEPGRRLYHVYLPLYNGVKSVAIGIARGAVFQPVPPRTARPLVFYGTSILQGGCASRPGMAHVAILGRRLDRPVLNLGFSGNGQMDLAVAELLAELEPSVYIIDCLPNMSPAMVTERAEPFVRTLRRTRPTVPIVLVEDRTYSAAWLKPDLQKTHKERRAALRQAFTHLAADDRNLHYIHGEALFGDDSEATVDGSHATDLGFVRMADVLEPILRPLCPV